MQKNSKVDIRKEEVCSKSVTKTFYGSKFLVSEYIFKLVYHCEGSRWSEICCARDIAKKSLNRLLLLLILKSSCPRCIVEKGLRALNFIKKRFQRRCFPVKFAKFFRIPTLKNICERLLLYLHVIVFTMHEKDTANGAWLEPS